MADIEEDFLEESEEVVPKKKSKQGKDTEKVHWTDKETSSLLSVWAEKKDALDKMTNKTAVYIRMSEKMLANDDVTRDWKQVKEKVKNMKAKFNKVRKELPTSGGGGDQTGQGKWRYYDRVRQLTIKEAHFNPDLFPAEESALSHGEGSAKKPMKREPDELKPPRKRSAGPISEQLIELVDLEKKQSKVIDEYLEWSKAKTIEHDAKQDEVYAAILARLTTPALPPLNANGCSGGLTPVDFD